MAGTLYVVATPIGNIADITDRARQVLADVDFIAAEDTRQTGLLLKALGIGNRVVSNHKFNEKHREDFILSALAEGQDVAVVSDAGTPCMSDPGGIVVRAAVERGIGVTAVCGASAVAAALSVCGFAFDSFAFYGFLPKSQAGIRRSIADAAQARVDVSVFFDSPRRIMKSLAVFAADAPGAGLCLCNDLTKPYERIYRGAPQAVLEELAANPSAEKGEYTLVCAWPVGGGDAVDGGDTGTGGGASERGSAAAGTYSSLSPEAAITDYLAKNGGTLKDAVNHLANERIYKRNALYKASLNLHKPLSGQ